MHFGLLRGPEEELNSFVFQQSDKKKKKQDIVIAVITS